jgi:peptide/nickel transport system permease protein
MSTATETTLEAIEERKQRRISIFLSRLAREKPLGLVGMILVLVMLITGIFADWLAPYGMNELHMTDRLALPGGQYALGTDNLGRDLLSRIIYGARVSIIIGLSATTISSLVGAAIGLTSGYLGGKFDLIVQRFIDAFICFPMLILYLTLMAVIGAGYVQLILVLGIGGGISGSRGARSLAYWVKESVYFDAARTIGSSTRRVILYHLLPNVMPMLIIGFSMSVGGIILAEASLSFLGFGLPAEVASWGGMLSGSNRVFMEKAPWLVVWPGIALALAVYGLNMFGDAVRDLLDPRLRGGVGGLGQRGMQLARKAMEKKQRKEAHTTR